MVGWMYNERGHSRGLGRLMAGAVVALVGGTVLAAVGQAATMLDPSGRFVIQWWTEADGLPETPLTGVVASADGTVLCSSRTQLVRFNGQRFEPVPAAVTKPLHDAIGTFWSVSPDGQGGFWVRGAKAVARLVADPNAASGHRWQAYAFEPGSIHGMGCGPEGQLVLVGPGVLLARAGERLARVDGGEALDHCRYGDVDPQDGTVWLWGGPSQDRRLYRTAPGGAGSLALPHQVNEPGIADALVTMGFGPDGPVALLTDGLAACRQGHWERLELPLPVGEQGESGKLAVAADGTIWISRHDGLTVVRDGCSERVTRPIANFSFFTRGLTADETGGVWAACAGGLVAVRPARLGFTAVPGCQAIFARADGSVLVGVPGSVLREPASPETCQPRPEPEPIVKLPADAVPTAVLEDDSGRIWVGTQDHYLFRRGDGEVKQLTRLNERFRELRTITALAHDTTGHVWVGSSNGLAIHDATSDEFALLNPGSDRLRATVIGLVADPLGGVLVATPAEGVRRIMPDGSGTTIVTTEALPGGRRIVLARDERQRIWVGGEQGLLGVGVDGRMLRLGTATGLVAEGIRQLATDGQGRLWVAFRDGQLQGLRLDELDALADGSGTVVRGVVLGPRDGIGTGEVSGRALMAPGSGEIVIPTTDGFGRLRPEAFAAAAAPGPAPLIQQADGGRPVFTVSVPGLEWSEPTLVQTRLVVSGGGDWSAPRPPGRLDLAAIAAGEHRLEVRAVAGESDRDFTTTSLAVRVPMPWWQSPAAIAAVIAAVAAAAAMAAREVTRRRARRTIERLERQREADHERTRIARDIHDALGAGLTRMALSSDLARRKELSAAAAGERFDAIYRDARGLARTVDEIVWAINPRNDTLGEFVSYAVSDMEESVEAAGLTMRLDLPGMLPEHLPLPTHLRHHLCMTIREVTTNILKHADAAHVDVAITLDGPTLTIRIDDDGRGFGPDTKPAGRGNGLLNMRQRIASLGGTISITSAAGAGTSVMIAVPLPAAAEASRPAE